MEHILILIAEIGGAGAVFYGLFVYLFKNAFTTLMGPLAKSIDALAFNVGEMTDDNMHLVDPMINMEGITPYDFIS